VISATQQTATTTTSVTTTNSEPETDEVAEGSNLLLEEIRSDCSDSGLGLDTLRNISVIEKSLAALTPSKSSLKRRSSDALHDEQPKKSKQGINFGDVTVFYFPRCQGFGCVPTQGGSTLGMTSKHAYKKYYKIIHLNFHDFNFLFSSF
jgi:cysteine/serine-rich nuclear protein